MSNLEWAAYVAVALAYGGAFYWSIRQQPPMRAAKVVAAIMSVIVGAAWIVAMPVFSFYVLFSAGGRGRA